MKITLQEIKKDPTKIHMWIQGFQHGNIGIPKQIPSYHKMIYSMGYKSGKEGRVDLYLKMANEDSKNVRVEKSYTRDKRGNLRNENY